MSDFDWDDDNDNSYEHSQGGALRKQLEDFQKKYRDSEKRASDLEGRLNDFMASRALETRGLPPKAARYMKADGIDVSDDKAVDTWLSDNSDLFAFGNRDSAPNGQTAPPPPAEPDVDTSGFQRLADLRAGREPEVTASAIEDFVNNAPEDMSTEEFLQRAQAQFG